MKWKPIELFIEQIIFASRWVQLPLYLGLIVAAILYTYRFTLELWHLTQKVNHIEETLLLSGILTLVDIIMVCNLLVMVIIGGYTTFVSRIDVEHHEDRPEWLTAMDAGSMKVKLAASLVGVSGVHLLKTFINIGQNDYQVVMWQAIVHSVFLFTTMMLAYTEAILKKNTCLCQQQASEHH